MQDVAARLRQRAAEQGLEVPDHLGSQLLAYFDLLQRWNRKINLTSLSNSDEAVDRLLLEPVAAARTLPRHASLADLGSGGGSPAIPLALALDAPQLLMIESRSRKAAFLREAARELGLNAIVEAARFEDVCRRPTLMGRFDVVSLRAVRPDADALSAAASLLKSDGIVALFVGPHVTASSLPLPRNLAWRATQPLLRSRTSHLAVLFHVEQS